MCIDDKLYEVVKNIDMRKVDFRQPADVWRIWVKEDSETWSKFTFWYVNDFLTSAVNNREELLWYYFSGYKDDHEAFANDWIAENEKHDFFLFYAEKVWEESVENITV
ncbi:MAG: hypothetical protein MRJ65_02155 [Candidatus Brocadiaceae bacterium]|nr:hypothetical protein [Candidatus Brocadiaceae bacterium]